MPSKYPQRKSIRLPGFDYSSNGIYYVTIDAFNKNCIFGDIKNDEMIRNEFGLIANNYWKSIPSHFQNTKLLDFIVMPNHVHGIIIIRNNAGAACCAPTQGKKQNPAKGSLGAIIRSYKSAVTRTINIDRLIVWPVWQRGYHDEIIRSNKELQNIINYIKSNPANWDKEIRGQRHEL